MSVPSHAPSMTDIPAMLREMASQVESGKKPTDSLVLVTLTGETINLYAWGAFEGLRPFDVEPPQQIRSEVLDLLFSGLRQLGVTFNEVDC